MRSRTASSVSSFEGSLWSTGEWNKAIVARPDFIGTPPEPDTTAAASKLAITNPMRDTDRDVLRQTQTGWQDVPIVGDIHWLRSWAQELDQAFIDAFEDDDRLPDPETAPAPAKFALGWIPGLLSCFTLAIGLIGLKFLQPAKPPGRRRVIAAP